MRVVYAACCKDHILEARKKDVFQTLSSTIELRNFDFTRRYRNEAFMLGVLYLYATAIRENSGIHLNIYNTLLAWAG